MFKTISLPSDLLDNDYFKVTTVWDGKRLSYPSKNHIHVCIEGNNLLVNWVIDMRWCMCCRQYCCQKHNNLSIMWSPDWHSQSTIRLLWPNWSPTSREYLQARNLNLRMWERSGFSPGAWPLRCFMSPSPSQRCSQPEATWALLSNMAASLWTFSCARECLCWM